MFVADNTLKTVQNYFSGKLSSKFSHEEVQSLFRICLESVLKLSSSDLILNSKRTISESDLLKVRSVVKELLKGEPIQYILGETEFCDLIFKVDKRVLIPRPETEELVSIISKENTDLDSILDIGTGSGCIPISLKKSFPKAKVYGIDVSNDALKVAVNNSESLNLDVKFVQDDILQSKFETDFEFDLIVSNPPYVLESDKKEMNENVLSFEPHLALFVEDENPLQFYEAILKFSQKNLKKGGKLYFEIHESMGNRIKKLFLDHNYIDVEIRKDFYGKDRIAIGKK